MGWIGPRTMAWCVCCALGIAESTARAQSAPAADTMYTLRNTRIHELHSAVNGRDYRLTVALPRGYLPTSASRYPVLYLLDGAASLPVAAITYRTSHRGASDSLILVGISYPGGPEPPSGSGANYRTVDYTLPVSPRSDSATLSDARAGRCCGAALTNRAFREEIIPLIDSLYRTTNDRGIFGHSYGGLFANYILFADPDLFQRYAITSPSLWWDSFAIFDHEAVFAETHTALRKQVYFSIGSLEGGAMEYVSQRMAATLRARNYEGLDLMNVELEGAYHSSMAEYSRALDLLYPVRLGIYTYGDSAVNAAARRVAEAYFADYNRRDAGGMRRHLAGDSAFQAIIDDRIVLGRDAYEARMGQRFKSVNSLELRVDTLRVAGESDQARVVASFSETTTPRSGRSVTTHGRMMLELRLRPEGWRIVHALHEPKWPTPVTTVVSVKANGRGVATALVALVDDRGLLASASTDSAGIARLPYDWHVSRGGYLQVNAPRYALAMAPLPDRDSVSVTLRETLALDSAAIERYVGTFRNDAQQITLSLTREGRALMIDRGDRFGGRTRLTAEFLSPTRLAVRDGTDIAVTLDASGRATELQRGQTRYTRR